MVDRTLPLDDAEPPRGVAEVVDIGSDDDDDGGGGAWSESDEGYSGGAGSRGDLDADADAVVPYGLRGALSPAPVFGNVAVANSTDVQFGNKTFFNGPVTIRQVVYAADAHGAADAAVQHAASCVGPAEPASDAVDVKVVGTTVVCCGGARLNAALSRLRDAWRDPGRRARLLLGLSLFLLFAVSLVVLLLSFCGPSGDAAAADLLTPEANLTLGGKLKIISREEWEAKPARERDPIQTPVPYVIVSHTASEGCATRDECVVMVRNVQFFHMDGRNWSDIAYNFLVGGDGNAYEGRGWGIMGAHAYGYNNRSTGITVVGTFIDDLPPERQLLALRRLIELGVAERQIADDYKLLAHRQVSSTESPGAALYKELQTWPHWAPTP